MQLRDRSQAIIVIAATLCGGIVATLGLSNQALWDDEAHTALFARNLLRFGILTAWDGRNLIAPRGGAELDRNLLNVTIPPLQFYLAAAGLAVFGETTFAARIPFVLVGLLTIPALGLYTRALLGTEFPWCLPSWLLALNPTFLLYIRNCRYFAPAMLLTVVLVWAVIQSPRKPLTVVGVWGVAVGTTMLMILNHQLIAGYTLAMLPVHFLLKRFRTINLAALILVIYLAAVSLYLSPFARLPNAATEVYVYDPTPTVTRVLTLVGWNLRGLATHEFFPVAVVAFLVLPLIAPVTASVKEHTHLGWMLAALVLTAIAVTAGLAPTPVHLGIDADMRYLVPLIPLGAVLTAIALAATAQLSKGLSWCLLIVGVTTNVLSLGYLSSGSSPLTRGIGSTLWLYLYEVTHDYESATDALVQYAAQQPKDAKILTVPSYFLYPLMFYHPQLLYCCQVDEDKEIALELRSQLSSYLFWGTHEIDLAIVGADPAWPAQGELVVVAEGRQHNLGWFRLIDTIDVVRKDFTRPELPWRAFTQSETENLDYRGFFVAQRSDAKHDD